MVPDVLTGITDEADNCGTLTMTQSPAAGVAFNGQTTITVTATDASGNTTTCKVTVTIVDDTDPVITCPANITVGTDVDKCDAVVTYSIPTATDDCPGVVVTRTSGLASGAIFPVGVNTVNTRLQMLRGNVVMHVHDHGGGHADAYGGLPGHHDQPGRNRQRIRSLLQM